MSNRRKLSWTEHQVDKLNKVRVILEELKDYKPLTLRQVYYQLVGKGYIENSVTQYQMLSRLLKQARIDGYVSWEDMEDRVRVFHDLTGWDDSDQFIRASMRKFLKGYQRDLIQTQDIYPEIWIEKDALASVFTKIATPYTIPVVVARGFSSVSFLNDYRDRLQYKKDKSPVLLYFGDFDPSGVEMLRAMKETLLDELEIPEIEFIRVALLKDDIFTYRLPHSPDALKKTDSRASKHIAEYGELAVELDALSPPILEMKIKESIEKVLDMDLFYREQEENSVELYKLNKIHGQVKEYLDQIL